MIWHDMQGKGVLIPIRTIKESPVLRECQQIVDPEVCASRHFLWREFALQPIYGIRRWFAQIIDARPDEFAANILIPLHSRKFAIGNVTPRRGIAVVRINARVVAGTIEINLVRRKIFRIVAIFRQRACRFAVNNRNVRIFFIHDSIQLSVIPASYIEVLIMSFADGAWETAANTYWTSRIFRPHDLTKRGAALCRRADGARHIPDLLPWSITAAVRNFISDRPNEDRSMIPVAPYKLAQFRRDIVFQRFILSA